MDTEHYGNVRTTFMTFGAMSKLLKKIPDYKVRSGREICIASASVLCFSCDDSSIDGEHLTDLELSVFAEKYIENYPMLLEEKGSPVDLPRNDGENSIDFFGRVLVAYINRSNASMVRVVDRSGIVSAVTEANKFSGVLKENSALSALSGLNSATDSLRSALNDVERFKWVNNPAMKALEEVASQNKLFESLTSKSILEENQRHREMLGISIPDSDPFRLNPHYEIPQMPIMPPNPIHKTNEKLEDLNERMEAFAEDLAGHLKASAVALQDVAVQIEKGSKGTSTQNKIAIFVAALSLFVAVVSFFKDSFKQSPPPAPEQKPPSVAAAPVSQIQAPLAQKVNPQQPVLASPKRNKNEP